MCDKIFIFMWIHVTKYNKKRFQICKSDIIFPSSGACHFFVTSKIRFCNSESRMHMQVHSICMYTSWSWKNKLCLHLFNRSIKCLKLYTIMNIRTLAIMEKSWFSCMLRTISLPIRVKVIMFTMFYNLKYLIKDL